MLRLKVKVIVFVIHQSWVRALLDHSTLLDHAYFVCVLNCAQSVRNHNTCSSFLRRFKSFLYDLFRLIKSMISPVIWVFNLDDGYDMNKLCSCHFKLWVTWLSRALVASSNRRIFGFLISARAFEIINSIRKVKYKYNYTAKLFKEYGLLKLNSKFWKPPVYL